MKEQALLTIISPCAFLLGMMITAYAVTANPGGSAKLSLLGNGFEIKNNDVDFEQLFSSEKYKKTAKAAAIKAFSLYELNENEANEALLEKIEQLSYDSKFAKRLVHMRDHFIGPFKAPDQEVLLVFDKNIPQNRAEVCPQSNFYSHPLNIASSDHRIMAFIEQANLAAMLGCPVQGGEKEIIKVNPEVGKDLRIDNASAPVDAIAKALPAYILIKSN